ncbi:hypothetical protein ACFV29_21985 [Streptomyces sp. NPDC059690]|uniref:hypothetical protein n=1 Tax=Streptomyces sp. NPDC059690 TaxID=3346907 RepID=UPI003685D920
MAELGGLDGVVVRIGVAAFGPADDVEDAVSAHLMAVNALCPRPARGPADPPRPAPGCGSAPDEDDRRREALERLYRDGTRSDALDPPGP